MFKKIISIPIVFTIVTSLSMSAYASGSIPQNDKTEIQSLKINYNLDKGHNNKSKQELIDGMVNEGVNSEDADYYAKLDILAAKLEKESKKINFDEISSYSDEDTNFNMFEIRSKALNLDERAIKTIFEHSSVIARGTKDMQELQKSNKSITSLNNATIKYPDGSSVTRTGEVVKIKPETDESYTTDTWYPGPWSGAFGEDDMYQEVNLTSSGYYYDTNDIKFESSSYWAKVNNTFTYQIKNNGYTDHQKWSVHYINSQGASSSSGFITVTDSATHQGESATGDDYIQGYTAAKFTISSSVGGEIGFYGIALNFSVSGGDSWNEYAIVEVCGAAVVLFWEAYFK
ncbi:hypothetical protein [Paenibacillus durus]|uniref:Uncharacterized protein n=1 Tax=Paenibacillus durus TaxID=44251 RepID=A0A089HFT6_PAEDU|nr:hypothetical protein [Paenibacillus durus]AIQ10801.1 hypothetical protein PDUR_01265 [Paenibacillus durus]